MIELGKIVIVSELTDHGLTHATGTVVGRSREQIPHYDVKVGDRILANLEAHRVREVQLRNKLVLVP